MGGPAASIAPTSGETLEDFDVGFLVGILVGEGHFGGDGRQPQVTLRMHADHEALFRWLERRFPGSRLYGPYEHAGRRYYQWMARGRFLRDELLPLLRGRLRPEHSGRVWGRYVAMCADYGLEPLEAAGVDARQGPVGAVARGSGPTGSR
jgi:hypothetical protein